MHEYFERCKEYMKWSAAGAAFVVVVVIAFCITRAFLLQVNEDSDLITKNQALFMTHCIKHDTQPWYLCELVWKNFDYQQKYYYNVEVVKYN